MTLAAEVPPPAPSRRSLEVLQAEHREIERVLVLFESAIERVRAGRPVSPVLLRDTVEFFQQYADVRHHAKEERRLFPLLADHGAGSEMTAVHALLAQHDTGRAYVREMRAAIARLADGDRLSAFSLVATAHAYIELLREHIRIEDVYVYPLASQYLTDEDDARLCRQFSDYARRHETAEDRRRHSRMLAAYERLAAE